VRNKVNASRLRAGRFPLREDHLPARRRAAGERASKRSLAELNADPKIHGILVQLPLPKHFDSDAVLKAIAPEKDVDGFHAENVGALMQGHPRFIPCTPYGVMKFLADAGIDPKGKEAVILGRSNIVGKPMAMLLMQASATVTICHSQTRDLAFHTRRADILVAALGKARFVTAEMVKPGAVVIDVGINRLPDGKLCGDVDFAGSAKSPH
jgi:methylenetetrahydrofolate dehydrogenase (NADP+)/methenyltetrahydrofolate cyclohydrolase